MFTVMEAKTLNCPMCGASASTDATKCLHCGARLATVACPSCFGMIFRGAKFCCHCGAKAARKEAATRAVLRCPRCRASTKLVVVGESELRECPKCEGIWADADVLQKICADREQQAAALGVSTTILPAAPLPPRLRAVLEQGVVALQITGNPGETYIIEASDFTPDWTAIGAKTLTDKVGVFVDPAQSQYPKRLYRIRN
jgi:hypothetical protein